MLRLALFALLFPLAAAAEQEDPASAGAEGPDSFPEVVRVEVGGSLCTATVVGPRALLTAAHCGYLLQADIATVYIGGQSLSAAVLRSPGYRGLGTHDIALLALDEDLPGLQPASLGGMPTLGAMVTIAGYGDRTSGLGGPPSLHSGSTKVAQVLSAMRIQLEEMDGDVARLGDSGGPVFSVLDGRRVLLGVISSGNGSSWTRAIRLDAPRTLEFLQDAAARAGVGICGIGLDCAAG